MDKEGKEGCPRVEVMDECITKKLVISGNESGDEDEIVSSLKHPEGLLLQSKQSVEICVDKNLKSGEDGDSLIVSRGKVDNRDNNSAYRKLFEIQSCGNNIATSVTRVTLNGLEDWDEKRDYEPQFQLVMDAEGKIYKKRWS